MKINRYYLIRPKFSLRKFASGMDELSSEILNENKLWESPEGGKSSWTLKDYSSRAKLAFLMHLKIEYQGAPGIDVLLSEKISEQLFDRHWDIEALELSGNVNETSATLLSREDISPSESININEWLDSRTSSDLDPIKN